MEVDFVQKVYVENEGSIAEEIAEKIDIRLKHYFDESIVQLIDEHHKFLIEGEMENNAFKNICFIIIIVLLGAILYFTITG